MCSLSTLDCALATVVLICFRNVRLWSNVTPRNLACLVVGIGVLCIWSGGMYSLVYFCTIPVMISSVVLFSFKVTQPLQNDKNCQKYDFPDFCLILIFNQRTTFCEILGVKILAEML